MIGVDYEMYNQQTFNDQNEVGKVAEQATAKYLLSKGYLIQDMTGDYIYQGIDIDFIVTSPTNKELTLEIKGDQRMHSTGNICLETVSGNRKGFFEFSQADKLCVMDMINNILYFFDFAELRDYVNSNKDRIKYHSFELDFHKEAYLLPVIDAMKLKSARKIKLGS